MVLIAATKITTKPVFGGPGTRECKMNQVENNEEGNEKEKNKKIVFFFHKM